MHQETLALLTLTLTPGLGLKSLQRLVKEHASPSQILSLESKDLRRLRLPPEAIASLLSGRSRKLAEESRETVRRAGIQIISPFDSSYPRQLAEIFDPPLILFVLGNPQLLNQPGVSLVGSRRCSVYGRQVTKRLASDLAATGLVIISGLARGIDAVAHQGALDACGSTVAVLGSGVDVPYPRENRTLYERVVEHGCVVSEFPCGSFPAPQNFPIRNRVISGLALGTVIAEAAEFSGSLITARLTLEQNRELWAVPGNITSKGSYGPNYLIKQGAGVVIEAQDVLDDLPLHVLESLRRLPTSQGAETEDRQPVCNLSEDEKTVLSLLLVDRGLHPDQLIEKLEMTSAELSQALLHLQLKGLVLQSPGQLYSRKLF